MKDQTILFEPIVPFPGQVDIDALLNEIEAVIKRHVVLPDHAEAALAVWVLHTYTFELRDTVAYVAIESPEKRCGKTTLLSVLAAMAHKPLIASNVTVGALFRAIDMCRPALFIDEADTFLAGNTTMRGIINSGNTCRTAFVLRLSKSRWKTASSASAVFGVATATATGSGSGPAILPVPLAEPVETGLKKYSCWCPKVIAMIGRVPDTIADRSIVVHMARKLVEETCAQLAELDPAEIRSKCARFALEAGPAIARAPKVRAEGLNDRAADTFDPLSVIARLAGGEWEQKLPAAALALASSTASHTPNSGAELLLDVMSVFIEYGREKIFSRDLAIILQRGANGATSLTQNYSGLNEHRVAQWLRPYGVKPRTFRLGQEVNKGYAMEDLREALLRYVPKPEVQARLEEMMYRSKLEAEGANVPPPVGVQPPAGESQPGMAGQTPIYDH